MVSKSSGVPVILGMGSKDVYAGDEALHRMGVAAKLDNPFVDEPSKVDISIQMIGYCPGLSSDSTSHICSSASSRFGTEQLLSPSDRLYTSRAPRFEMVCGARPYSVSSPPPVFARPPDFTVSQNFTVSRNFTPASPGMAMSPTYCPESFMSPTSPAISPTSPAISMKSPAMSPTSPAMSTTSRSPTTSPTSPSSSSSSSPTLLRSSCHRGQRLMEEMECSLPPPGSAPPSSPLKLKSFKLGHEMMDDPNITMSGSGCRNAAEHLIQRGGIHIAQSALYGQSLSSYDEQNLIDEIILGIEKIEDSKNILSCSSEDTSFPIDSEYDIYIYKEKLSLNLEACMVASCGILVCMPNTSGEVDYYGLSMCLKCPSEIGFHCSTIRYQIKCYLKMPISEYTTHPFRRGGEGAG